MQATCLKPSEYRGDQNTAVAGRIVILKQQEVKVKKPAHSAAAPAAGKKGKGGKGGKAGTDQGSARKLEAHLAGTESLSEVLYVEAWGEIGDQLAQKCVVGDVVAIQGGSFIATPAQYSTSRLHYHLRLKGALGLQVFVQKLEQAPWPGVPTVHPLVPLQALSRVKDRQQICVAVSMVENPGTVERQTKEGPAAVCNAIVQQGATRVRCAFWHEQAQELAELQPGTCVMLYQVLISKRKEENSWEIGSWRGTTIVPCSTDMATMLHLGCKRHCVKTKKLRVRLRRCLAVRRRRSRTVAVDLSRVAPCLLLDRRNELAHKDNCRMLTEIPVKDWIGCPATPSSLSTLVAAIVPGQLRKLETVFEVVGLQVLGVSSVKSDTDHWLIDSCVKCKKAAPCEAPRACSHTET